MKICGEYGVLPSSHIIPQSKIRKLGDSPVSFGGFPDIWSGTYKEDNDKENKYVAIKFIRYCESADVQQVEKVRHSDPLPLQSSLTAYRSFVERSSPGSVDLIQTYWS